jgi:Lon protease-like protein
MAAPSDASHELPLFPLQTVLFPGGPLQLRIFEPRYVDMVARCLRGANRFGVVAIRGGAEAGAASFHDVGTAAEIVDWHQEKDGLLGLLALGRERFKVGASRRQPDGLYVGRIEWLAEPPPADLPTEHAPLARLLETLIEPVAAYRNVPRAYGDSAWVGARLTEALPLPIARKQALLEQDDALARLDALAAELVPPPGHA